MKTCEHNSYFAGRPRSSLGRTNILKLKFPSLDKPLLENSEGYAYAYVFSEFYFDSL